jgi:hypothetical protein
MDSTMELTGPRKRRVVQLRVEDFRGPDFSEDDASLSRWVDTDYPSSVSLAYL